MRRWILLGLLAFFLAGTVGCAKEEKPPEQTAPRAPRLPRPPGQDKKKDQGHKP